MHRLRGITLFLLSLAIVAFVLGGRWTAIHYYGTDLPEWDQWDAQGLATIIPWVEGRHFLSALFAPHNEHRVVLTKLINLGITLTNGQWDQRLEATLNALLPATLALSFFLYARRFTPSRALPLIGLLAAALYGLPFAWQNVLSGFHSQQYLLIGLALATLILLSQAKPYTIHWWLGALAALLNIFTMGSGFFASAIMIVLCLIQLWKKQRSREQIIPTLCLSIALTLLGITLYTHVNYHDALKAQNASDFILTLLKSLAWPWHETLWPSILFWLPCLLLFIPLLKNKISTSLSVPFLTVLGLGGWVFLQLLATAYARGAGGQSPSSRYIDTLIVGVLANALALGWLYTASTTRRLRLAVGSLSAVWLTILLIGLQRQAHIVIEIDLPNLHPYRENCLTTTRAYLKSKHLAALEASDIPYPSATAYRERLDKTILQKLLPASVRAPYALKPEATSTLLTLEKPLYRPDINAWSTASLPESNKDATWTSEPMRSTGPTWLRLELKGKSDGKDIRLELIEPQTHSVLQSLPPDFSLNDHWQIVDIPAPSRPFKIRVQDKSPQGWIAFSEPVALGRYSRIAETLTQSGKKIARYSAWFAIILATLLLLFSDRSAAFPLRNDRQN